MDLTKLCYEIRKVEFSYSLSIYSWVVYATRDLKVDGCQSNLHAMLQRLLFFL